MLCRQSRHSTTLAIFARFRFPPLRKIATKIIGFRICLVLVFANRIMGFITHQYSAPINFMHPSIFVHPSITKLAVFSHTPKGLINLIIQHPLGQINFINYTTPVRANFYWSRVEGLIYYLSFSHTAYNIFGHFGLSYIYISDTLSLLGIPASAPRLKAFHYSIWKPQTYNFIFLYASY